MKLYESWKESYENLDNAGYETFWREYLPKEMENYKYILSHKDETVGGKLVDIADKFNMETVTFAGFIDGINDSLKESIDLDELTEDSNISLNVDFEKLYYNMLDAKADWLYNLDEWDGVLSTEKRKQIKKEYDKTKTVVKEQLPGRNEPCPCGSGKKYKKCCGAK
ncbi:SEC-C domain protein [Peptoclostridium acidaminophilum DSM 3953]|uniref:SEC-C domain protein n=1 Tax=Peptoclostridium acidaminophilum DSM 3953 TaxID=1286171 RepID=W8T5T8_PEPAC|nr:SEC-C metal-binding domain-containing protein [Peptoclostridium acidaminophilum]AHM57104.1 SEC-C domain protein [Peptoclostridium acidaminophilum DSM 3953]